MIAIAAVSKNWIIGDSKANKMPWPNQKEDLAHFREITSGGKLNVCICGRKTSDSIKGHLKGRTIWTLTKQEANALKGHISSSMFDYIKKHKDFLCAQGFNYCLIGGASIYHQFLHYCDELYLTQFDFEAKGDIKFPFNEEQIQELFPNKELVKNITNGQIFKYSR